MADFSENIKFSRNFSSGRIELAFTLTCWDSDWIVEFYGGKRCLGSVQVWSKHSELKSEIQFNPVEKQDYLTIKILLEKVHDLPFNRILFYGGIHYDHISERESDFIRNSANQFGDWIRQT